MRVLLFHAYIAADYDALYSFIGDYKVQLTGRLKVKLDYKHFAATADIMPVLCVYML